MSAVREAVEEGLRNATTRDEHIRWQAVLSALEQDSGDCA